MPDSRHNMRRPRSLNNALVVSSLMTVNNRGAPSDEVRTEGTDSRQRLSCFVHFSSDVRSCHAAHSTAQHKLRHSIDRPAATAAHDRDRRRRVDKARSPNGPVDLGYSAAAAAASGCVADTSNQETLQNRTNEQNRGRVQWIWDTRTLYREV